MSHSIHDKFCTAMLRHFYQDLCELAERWQNELVLNRNNQTSSVDHSCTLDSDSLGVSMCSESTTQADLDEHRVSSADFAPFRAHQQLHLNLSPSELGALDQLDQMRDDELEQEGAQVGVEEKQQDDFQLESSSQAASQAECELPTTRPESTGNRSKWHVAAVSIGLSSDCLWLLPMLHLSFLPSWTRVKVHII